MTRLTSLQKDLLLQVVANYMQSDLRQTIMRELPDAYNAWMGRTVVSSKVIDTNQPIIERTEDN